MIPDTPTNKIDWKSFIPAAVTIIALVVVFLVGKYAPEDLQAVTELVETLQPLLITVILAIVGKSTVKVAMASYYAAKIDAAELQQVAEMECAKIYAATDSQKTDGKECSCCP